MNYFLDTDTFELFNQANAKVVRRASEIGSENLAITIVTRIEVLRARFEYLRTAADASQLRNAQHWLNESERLLAAWQIIPIEEPASHEFERLRSHKALRKIGRADVLIACITLGNRATLVTRNVRDFKLVPGLSIENWAD